MMVNNGGD